MRRLLFSLLMFCVLPAWADGHDQLYKVAGWPEQRAHFNDALTAAQQRYQNSLPPAVFQALLNNSNQRFARRPWINAPKRNCGRTSPTRNRR